MGKRSVLKAEFQRKRRAELTVPVFEWGGVFENWSRGFVKRNFWRVSAIFSSEEDALQECAAIFVHCRNKYACKLDEPKHMMSLYQTALTRAWHTYASKDPHFRYSYLEEKAAQQEDTHAVLNDGPLAVALSQCDAELSTVIHAIIEAPAEFLAIIFGNDDDTQKITQRISRIFRINAGDRDLIAELRELLSSAIT